MPIVQPTDLIGWLVENDLFPKVNPGELRMFWNNARTRGVDWAKAGNDRTHPLYLWADDAQYNERGSKLIVVVLGHALDENTNSLLSCYPLIVLRHVACMHLTVCCYSKQLHALCKS